ncbi:MAG: methylmalonyl Co-A mutase-associated GTPase MeaB [Bacteroidetes bacterium]|nr:methylmalonyl Co-A mutase-associated GTPase MeaB [Bacteroidota bacterium]
MHPLAIDLSYSNLRSLARCITIVENELDGFEDILSSLKNVTTIPVIGITGPPGAGKSSLLNELISKITLQKKRVAVLAIDPTSPFTSGSILGDRIRMSDHFNNPDVYIRSLATRGALGGLSAKTVEVVEVLKNAHFDYIFIETVGVGQSEVEIVGLADTVVLALVPESGDEVQTIKSGIMEIGHIYVVNKSDRAGSDSFIKNLTQLAQSRHTQNWEAPVLKTVATKGEGIDLLLSKINEHQKIAANTGNRAILLAEKIFSLIQHNKMRAINKNDIRKEVEQEIGKDNFNLYSFAKKYF